MGLDFVIFDTDYKSTFNHSVSLS